MTNKRQLKKYFTNVCGALATECIMAAEYVDGIDVDAMDRIILQVAGLQDHAVSRVSIAFDKTPADFENGREYTAARHTYYAEAFKALIMEFEEAVAAIIKQMNALLPAAQREANKSAAQA